MGVRLLRLGGSEYAVFAHGVTAGTIRKDTGLHLWHAIGLDGRQGVFPSKRAAAEWLATHTH